MSAVSLIDALVCSEPGLLRLEQRPAPRPEPGEALVRPRRIGICGTDWHAIAGRQPCFNYPRILGHELGVEVIEVNDGGDGSSEPTPRAPRTHEPQPELDEVVEGALVAGGARYPGLDHLRRSAQPRRQRGVPQVLVEQPSHRSPVPGARARRLVVGAGYCRPARERARGPHRNPVSEYPVR